MDCSPRSDRPFLFDDRDQWLEQRQASLYENIRGNGAVIRAIEPILESFDQSTF